MRHAASNYRNGRAESTVGKALSLLLAGIHASDFAKGRADVTRDALFISTKAGYLSPTLQQTLLTKGLISHGDVVGGGHCMAPACLRASVEESLEKMNIETVSSCPYEHGTCMMQCFRTDASHSSGLGVWVVNNCLLLLRLYSGGSVVPTQCC